MKSPHVYEKGDQIWITTTPSVETIHDDDDLLTINTLRAATLTSGGVKRIRTVDEVFELNYGGEMVDREWHNTYAFPTLDLCQAHIDGFLVEAKARVERIKQAKLLESDSAMNAGFLVTNFGAKENDGSLGTITVELDAHCQYEKYPEFWRNTVLAITFSCQYNKSQRTLVSCTVANAKRLIAELQAVVTVAEEAMSHGFEDATDPEMPSIERIAQLKEKLDADQAQAEISAAEHAEYSMMA